jgi:hypothetical protein
MEQTKHCPQCGQDKKLSEYYKNKTSKDGFQRCCKVCCNINSKKFREDRPEYYWGEGGYFRKRYKETIQYQLDMSRADKSSKIYMIETPDGVYIGSTKRFLYNRTNTHMSDYLSGKRGLLKVKLPLLHASFSKYTLDEVRKFLKDTKVLEEFDGDRYETKRKESYWMEYYKRLGFTLLNVRDAWGRISEKKSKEFGNPN